MHNSSGHRPQPGLKATPEAGQDRAGTLPERSESNGVSPARPRAPSTPRRFAAILYDSLLLFGTWFVAALPIPLVPEAMRSSLPGAFALRAYLLLVAVAFFGWFWTHGGQTLGMRAWRIRVVRDDGRPLRWADAVRRFAFAMLSWVCLGLGFAWSLFHPERLAWHDILSRTRLDLLPKT